MHLFTPKPECERLWKGQTSKWTNFPQAFFLFFSGENRAFLPSHGGGSKSKLFEMRSVFVWKFKVDLSESKKRYLCLKVLSVFVMVSWRQRRWWPHISCPCLSGSGFSLLAVLLFTLLLTRTCLEFRISRFSSPLLAFRYRPLYYSSALTHTNFHNTLISQICPATQNSKCGC